MSSMSSLQGSALIASYAASKAFNTILADTLWEELRHDGVHVLASIAGAISTPSCRHNTPADKQRKALPMTPEAVAAETLDALARGRGPRLCRVGSIGWSTPCRTCSAAVPARASSAGPRATCTDDRRLFTRNLAQ